MTSVVVFDYGFGNVRSMVRALSNVGVEVALTSDPRQSLRADGLVVPGVGAFAACVESLRAVGGERIVTQRLREGRPVLGVCVGQQIMFSGGDEHGIKARGLGMVRGEVRLLDADVVPHMGWNTVEAPGDSTLFQGIAGQRMYFVHSYAATQACDADASDTGVDLGQAPGRITWCEYGRTRFVAAYERGALSTTQFHPEKSAQAGSRLLRNWVDSLSCQRSGIM